MSTLVSGLAVLVLVLVGVYVLMLAIERFRSMARSKHLFEGEQAELRARVERLSDPIQTLEAQGNPSAWFGFRKFLLVGKVLEAKDVCSFYFAPHDGQPLPAFLPGQYLTFQTTPEDSDRPLIRCYSLSDSPTHPDYYRVTVKRIHGGDGAEDGAVSTHFHREVMPDALIDVKAPSGHFHLNIEEQTPVVLTGGGIGLTPLLSMVNYIAASGSKRETWLFYGVKNGADHAMKDYLNSVGAEHENIHIHVCYSQPRANDRQGVDYDHAERISVDLFKRLLPSNNYDFYTCGPASMMEQITGELTQWGVPENRIHYEAFGADTLKRVSRDIAPSPSGAPIEVEFARSGNTLLWDHGATSLLEFAEANGIPMDSGCRAGNCGSCLTALRSGSVEYLGPLGAPVDEGSCLTCISVPKGNLVLDA